MAKELQPTYGNFTLRGQIVWKDRKNAYREDRGQSGFPYRSLRFGVKTAEKNIVEVELFQTKFEKVTLQNIETKKRDLDVSYGEHTGKLPEGYRLFMPINLGIEQDESGENIREKMIPYDAIKYINDNLNNGDTVFIFGSPRYSEFTDREGNKRPQVTFEPRGIYKSTIGYGEEGFEGEAVFDQQLVINKSEKVEDKLKVFANVITDRKGNFVPYTFSIDIEKFKKFAMNVRKLKFGTLLSVEGFINHTVEEKEIQTDDAWGESPTKNTITNVIRELEITKAGAPKKEDMAFYSPEDFVKKVKEAEQDKDNPFNDAASSSNDDGDDWGDSPSSNQQDDPFQDVDNDW